MKIDVFYNYVFFYIYKYVIKLELSFDIGIVCFLVLL